MTGEPADRPAHKRRRLAVARFWYEGNAFCPLPADFAAFERYEWREGAAALAAAEGTATELGAVVAFARQRPDWEVVALRCASASPAGPITDDVFERYASELREGLIAGGADGPWDAVYLSLHGAAITEKRQSPDLDLVLMVRSLLPNIPIGASFDLHGNLSPEFADLLDFASVYRTHPHVDMAQTATRVLNGLDRCVNAGMQTRRALVNEGVVLPSFNMRTDAGPMQKLQDIARAETVAPMLEVSVFGGFPYADSVSTGASVFVVSDAHQDPSGAAATRTAQDLMRYVRALAPEFEVRLHSPAEAVASALRSEKPGLLAVTDPADNPLSGGSGDTPALLRALLEARPTVPCLFASFASPVVVAASREAGIGNSLEVTLGGRFGSQYGDGIRLRVTVKLLTDGVFRNTGPMETGVERRCGGSALLTVDQQPHVQIIVTQQVVAADDPAFFALHQIDLGSIRLLCVKAKNHFRAAFKSRCSEIIDCDAPGPASADLAKLPFRNLRLH